MQRPAHISKIYLAHTHDTRLQSGLREHEMFAIGLWFNIFALLVSCALSGVAIAQNSSTPDSRTFTMTLSQPEIKARLVDMGATVLGGSPEDFGRLTVAETEKWAKLVKFSGAKPE
jgi:hypothetical protein